jgi:Uma2 family endonuclease
MSQPYTSPMTSTPAGLVTAEALFDMPDNGGRTELVRGELREMSPGSPWSSEVGILIAAALIGHVRPRRLGSVFGDEAGFILARNPDTVRAPDVAFVRADRLPPPAQREFFLALAPDLVVEVLSPTDRAHDVHDKIHEYLEAGVRLVWLVDPRARRVTVCLPDRTTRTLGASDVLDGGDVLPGFQLTLADLFS